MLKNPVTEMLIVYISMYCSYSFCSNILYDMHEWYKNLWVSRNANTWVACGSEAVFGITLHQTLSAGSSKVAMRSSFLCRSTKYSIYQDSGQSHINGQMKLNLSERVKGCHLQNINPTILNYWCDPENSTLKTKSRISVNLHVQWYCHTNLLITVPNLVIFAWYPCKKQIVVIRMMIILEKIPNSVLCDVKYNHTKAPGILYLH